MRFRVFHLFMLTEISKIRLSVRRFYQKLTDIYVTAIDCNKSEPTTRLFYKNVQNKMHYAVYGHNAAELIIDRADAQKEHMGITTWENAPDGKIVKPDVSVAKNYLKENEQEAMGRIVNSFLDITEDMAKRHIPMTMEDWAKRIDKFLDVRTGRFFTMPERSRLNTPKSLLKQNLKGTVSLKTACLSPTSTN